MISALPMYDWPGVRTATDALYAAWRDAMRRRGLNAPQKLTRDRPAAALWADPDLLVGQTCGFPLVHGMCGDAQPVAAPCYDAVGCVGPRYVSALIMRGGEMPDSGLAGFRGRRAAINGWDSQSGFNALSAAVVQLAGVETAPFFAEVIVTGAHLASIHAVAEGRADVAAIDCVSWALAERLHPELTTALIRFADSPSAPGLPYITAGGRGADEIAVIRDALVEALAAPEIADARAALLLRGAQAAPLKAYGEIARMARRCAGVISAP